MLKYGISIMASYVMSSWKRNCQDDWVMVYFNRVKVWYRRHFK